MIDDFLIDKNISEPKENSESDDKITIKIIDVNNDSDDKNINDINGIDSNEVSNPESIEEQEEKNKNKTNVFKNPLPLVKFNKETATRYSINSIMKNFDSNNEMKNLTSVLANSKKILKKLYRTKTSLVAFHSKVVRRDASRGIQLRNNPIVNLLRRSMANLFLHLLAEDKIRLASFGNS